jgi:hypothetical protein
VRLGVRLGYLFPSHCEAVQVSSDSCHGSSPRTVRRRAALTARCDSELPAGGPGAGWRELAARFPDRADARALRVQGHFKLDSRFNFYFSCQYCSCFNEAYIQKRCRACGDCSDQMDKCSICKARFNLNWFKICLPISNSISIPFHFQLPTYLIFNGAILLK